MTAAVLDGLVIAAVVLAGYAAIAVLVFMWNPVAFSFPTTSWLVILGIAFALNVVYLTSAWTVAGRSYGQAVMGLRVLSPWGRKLRLPGAFLRAVFCTVFPIGLLWCAVSPQNRSAQDIVMRTSVVYDWQPAGGAEPPEDRLGGSPERS
jgi:uncharacterized RDD family membrane protein YckC